MPQVEVAVTGHIASPTPAATATHLPRLIGLAQVWQAPAQSFSQQTPSTQKPLSQSSLALQVWPGPNLPQLPFRQLFSSAHWSSSVQTRTHSPSMHLDGLHEMPMPSMQVPSPSQVLGGTNSPLLSQAPSLHTVSAG